MALAGLRDRVFMVTGAAGAIGRAVAERLLAEGAKVALVDVDREAVERVAVDIAQPERSLAVTADVSSVEGTDRYVDATLERFGRIDGLHNNAGSEGPLKPLRDVSPEEFDRLIALNVRGVFLGLRRTLQVLADQGSGGSIVNTASVLGTRGVASAAAYAASKAAVISLTKSAAIEAGTTGIRVNAVLPGPVEGRMIDAVAAGVIPEDPARGHELITTRLPMQRYGRPHEIAALVAWLLSDECTYATGGLYTADGGDAAT